MRLSNRIALVLACISLMLPRTTGAADVSDRNAKQQITDISLRADRVLVGYVVNSQGDAVSAAKVTVYHGRDVIAETTSDRNGRFVVRKLRGGIHQVVADETASIVRLWTTQAAPPAAVASLTIVSADKGLVRGQYDDDSGVPGLGGRAGRVAGFVALSALIAGIVWAVDETNEIESP
jgi:hypothetical protein